MFGRLFRRKPANDEQSRRVARDGDAKPTLWSRIKAFFLAIWNWMILLAAVGGAVICTRLTFVFWSSADELQGDVQALLYRLMAGASAAVAVFLFWQVGRGARYLWHHRRRAR